MGRRRDDGVFLQVGSQHRCFIRLRLAHVRKGILGERETLKFTFPETQRPKPLTSWSAVCGAGLPFPGGVRDVQRPLLECSAGKTPGLASAPSERPPPCGEPLCPGKSPGREGEPGGATEPSQPHNPTWRPVERRSRGAAGPPRTAGLRGQQLAGREGRSCGVSGEPPVPPPAQARPPPRPFWRPPVSRGLLRYHPHVGLLQRRPVPAQVRSHDRPSSRGATTSTAAAAAAAASGPRPPPRPEAPPPRPEAESGVGGAEGRGRGWPRGRGWHGRRLAGSAGRRSPSGAPGSCAHRGACISLFSCRSQLTGLRILGS